MKAIVLLSGGIDSTACLKFYLDLSYEVECIFCDYGQPASAPELQAAKIISGIYGVPLHIITTTSLSIPSSGEICGRNALLVLQALCFMGFGTYKIILGIHAGSNYADCSSNFVVSMNRILDYYANGTVCLEAPFSDWNKHDIIAYCKEKGIPYDITYSCEKGTIPPCGKCLSCLDRKGDFDEPV